MEGEGWEERGRPEPDQHPPVRQQRNPRRAHSPSPARRSGRRACTPAPRAPIGHTVTRPRQPIGRAVALTNAVPSIG